VDQVIGLRGQRAVFAHTRVPHGAVALTPVYPILRPQGFISMHASCARVIAGFV
jgi:hypothetical protein